MAKINKEYNVLSNIKQGATKSGNKFTIVSIKDSKKDPNKEGEWLSTFYKLFIWDGVDIKEGDKISFNNIKEVEYTEKQFGDKVYRDCILYINAADVKISGSDSAIGTLDGPTPFDDSDLAPVGGGYKAPWD